MNKELSERDPAAVRSMFNRIARRYDLANHLLSAGLDLVWRRRAAAIVRQWCPRRVLDLATGSGDLALAIARQLPEAEIVGADFSHEMLEVAHAKGLAHTVLADARRLPFPDGSYDAVTIAFGLRNISDRSETLQEMARVLRPGGHLLILDFSLPRKPLRSAYRLYLHYGLPWLARMITGERQAYTYLGASIEEFPSGDAMKSLLVSVGLKDAAAQSLTGGIVTLYSAQR